MIKNNLIPALRLTLVSIVLLVVIYPMLIWGGAQLAPGQGHGITLKQNGQPVGYQLLGQNFTAPEYFWPRPSAAGYNTAGSCGSNKGPFNPAYLAEVQARRDSFLVYHPYLQAADIPSDMVTASGSGLDPHISVQGARIQARRVAKVRGVEESRMLELVDRCTEKPLLGILGMNKVHVLRLNLLVDEFYPMPSAK